MSVRHEAQAREIRGIVRAQVIGAEIDAGVSDKPAIAVTLAADVAIAELAAALLPMNCHDRSEVLKALLAREARMRVLGGDVNAHR